MAKIYSVKRSREARVCSKCGGNIERGQPYTWAAPGFRSPKRYHCKNCGWRASELTTSKMSQAYAAIEAAEDAIDGADMVEDLTSILSEAADGLREVAEEYRSASQGWATGQFDEWDAKADALESSAEALDSWDYSEVDEDDADFIDIDEARESAREALGDVDYG